MSEAHVRKVEVRLERMLAQAAGPTVNQALAAASANLADLRPAYLRELDKRLACLTAFLGEDPSVRPSDETMDDLLHQADAALTVCGVAEVPFMAQALLLFSAQIDALKHTRYWPEGALTPAINFITLVRARTLNGEMADRLLGELRLCLDQYLRFQARETSS